MSHDRDDDGVLASITQREREERLMALTRMNRHERRKLGARYGVKIRGTVAPFVKPQK